SCHSLNRLHSSYHKDAGGVANKIADGTVAVIFGLKAINHSPVPFPNRPGRQLVNRADTVLTTIIGRPVDFTRASAKQGAVRKSPVGLAVKRIERSEIPFPNCCWTEFEYNSAAIHTACRSRTVKPTMLQKHPSGRTCRAVVAASERVYHLERITPGVRMEFVNRAHTVRAACRRHAVDISAPINGDPRSGAGSIVAACKRIDDCLVPCSIGLGEFVHDSAAAFTAT